MSWVSNDGRHEGFLAPMFADGAIGGEPRATPDGVQVWALRGPDGKALPYESWSPRDAATITGWVLRCDETSHAEDALPVLGVEAGSHELLRLRRAPSPRADDPRAGWVYARDDDALAVVDRPDLAAHVQTVWLEHVASAQSLGGVRAAAIALARAAAELDDAVAVARRHRRSWAAIGAEVGITRQAARERWARLERGMTQKGSRGAPQMNREEAR